MFFEMLKRAGETGRDDFAVAGRAQIAGDADYAHDGALAIAHRELGGETPSWAAPGVPVQFEVIDDRPAGTQDGLILCGVELGEFAREDFADVPAQKLID